MNTPKPVSPKLISSKIVSPKLPVTKHRRKSSFWEYTLVAIFLIAVTGMGVLTALRFIETQTVDPEENNINVLTEAANDNPDDMEVRLKLAYIYQQQEKWDDAKGVYSGVLKVDPKNQGALYNMAIIAASNGDYDEAEQGFKNLIQIYPGHLLSMIALSKLYVEEKKPDLALEYINKAIKISPQYADLYIIKGQAYELKGDKTSAKSQYQTSLKYIPEHPDALKGLERLK